jgi:large subunit ribosomal protein L30
MTEKRLAITLRRSCIGCPLPQKRVAKGLGLTRLHRTVIRLDTPEIQGMIRKIVHLVEVHEVTGEFPVHSRSSRK